MAATPAHPRKLCLFALLSLADLALTRFLLEHRGGGAYEQNPVAAWCLARFGWAGLAAFKLGSVALVAALALAVSRRRPRAAGRILSFGCAALLAVLLYSGSLVASVRAQAARLEQAEEKGLDLERELLLHKDYAALRVRVRDDLAARRCTLAEAVEVLAATEHVRSGNWMRKAGDLYPGATTGERLAAHLVESALRSLEEDPDRARPLAAELDGQFRSTFGRPVPCLAAPADDLLAGAW